MTRTFTPALAFLLGSLAAAPADGQAHQPRGTISWVPNSATAGDGTIVGKGKFTVGPNWFCEGIRFFALDSEGGLVYSVATEAGVGTWEGTLRNVPNGSYSVWVVMDLRSVDKKERQSITGVVQTGVRMTNSPHPAPATGGSITWEVGQPQRNSKKGTIHGSGVAAVKGDQGWQPAQKEPPVTLYALPAAGGLVLECPIDKLPKNTWTAAVETAGVSDYKVFALLKVEKKDGSTQVLGTPFAISQYDTRGVAQR